MENQVATAWAPASLSNLGPGFDALGAAIDGLGDQVSVERTSGRGMEVTFDTSGVWSGPTDAERNTAAVAAAHVADSLQYDGGLRITIKKGLAAGTGLGSSAASAVAGAVATEHLLGGKLSLDEMTAAVVAGESATSGHGHADNVLPSLLGGFVLMRSSHPVDHLRIEGWNDLSLMVGLPEAEVLTREARAALPGVIPLTQAVDHAARLALMMAALHTRDVNALGRWMMSDDVVIPARQHLWPYLESVVQAALEAGASGCTISGSGPAIVACFRNRGHAQQESIRSAMQARLNDAGLSALVSVHHIANHGALILDGDRAISWRSGVSVPAPTH